MPEPTTAALVEAYERAQTFRNERRWCDLHDALQPCVHCEVNAAELLVDRLRADNASLTAELGEARAQSEASYIAGGDEVRRTMRVYTKDRNAVEVIRRTTAERDALVAAVERCRALAVRYRDEHPAGVCYQMIPGTIGDAFLRALDGDDG